MKRERKEEDRELGLGSIQGHTVGGAELKQTEAAIFFNRLVSFAIRKTWSFLARQLACIYIFFETNPRRHFFRILSPELVIFPNELNRISRQENSSKYGILFFEICLPFGGAAVVEASRRVVECARVRVLSSLCGKASFFCVSSRLVVTLDACLRVVPRLISKQSTVYEKRKRSQNSFFLSFFCFRFVSCRLGETNKKKLPFVSVVIVVCVAICNRSHDYVLLLLLDQVCVGVEKPIVRARAFQLSVGTRSRNFD